MEKASSAEPVKVVVVLKNLFIYPKPSHWIPSASS